MKCLENCNEIIENNEPDEYKGEENDYKRKYSELIYKNLYDVMSGIKTEKDNNFTKLLKQLLNRCFATQNALDTFNLIKLLIGSVPSKIESTSKKATTDTQQIDISKELEKLI